MTRSGGGLPRARGKIYQKAVAITGLKAPWNRIEISRSKADELADLCAFAVSVSCVNSQSIHNLLQLSPK